MILPARTLFDGQLPAGVLVREARPDEAAPPLTLLELADDVLPAIQATAWTGIGYEAGFTFGRFAARADVRDFRVLDPYAWSLDDETAPLLWQPVGDESRWFVEFPQAGAYVRRLFWFDSLVSVDRQIATHRATVQAKRARAAEHRQRRREALCVA